MDRTDKLVFISSIDAVGMCTVNEYTEEQLPNPVTPYGLAKLCAEYYARNMSAEKNVQCITLRFSQVYGPDEPEIKIIPVIRKALTDGLNFNLFTSGKERRKYLYIDDAIQAIIRSICSDKTGVFNIAGNESISMNELIGVMEDTWEKKLNIIYSPVPAEGADNLPCIDKAVTQLGYIPEVSIRDGMMLIKNS